MRSQIRHDAQNRRFVAHAMPWSDIIRVVISVGADNNNNDNVYLCRARSSRRLGC
jgi:hypothetical protein